MILSALTVTVSVTPPGVVTVNITGRSPVRFDRMAVIPSPQPAESWTTGCAEPVPTPTLVTGDGLGVGSAAAGAMPARGPSPAAKTAAARTRAPRRPVVDMILTVR